MSPFPIAGHVAGALGVLGSTAGALLDRTGDALATAIDAATDAVDRSTRGGASAALTALDAAAFGALSRLLDTRRGLSATSESP